MKRWITIAMLAMLFVPLAFAQSLSDAEYQKLKEQIKREVIEELKAEYNLVPKTHSASVTGDQPVKAEPASEMTAAETSSEAPKVATPATTDAPKQATPTKVVPEQKNEETKQPEQRDNRSIEERRKAAQTG